MRSNVLPTVRTLPEKALMIRSRMDSTVVPRKTIDIIAAKQRRRQCFVFLLFAIVIMSDSAENTGSEQLTIRVKDQVRSDCTNSGFISFDLLPGAGSYRVWTSKVATASIWAVFLPSSCTPSSATKANH